MAFRINESKKKIITEIPNVFIGRIYENFNDYSIIFESYYASLVKQYLS
jgi:hypothetical protein